MTATPLATAQVVARNVAPLAGILFLGWDAVPVLLLYFSDTMLTLAVLFAGALRQFAPPIENDGLAARLNGEAGMIGAAAFVMLVLAVPLGMPLVFILAGRFDWRTLLDDPGFRIGLLWQLIAAAWAYAGLYRALRTATAEQLRLKRRFALVLLRWMVMVALTYTGLAFLFGRYSALFFVAAYVVVSVWAEIAPDRFLRAMPGGAEDAEPPPRPAASIAPRGRRRRR